jgi:hypothetical protein
MRPVAPVTSVVKALDVDIRFIGPLNLAHAAQDRELFVRGRKPPNTNAVVGQLVSATRRLCRRCFCEKRVAERGARVEHPAAQASACDQAGLEQHLQVVRDVAGRAAEQTGEPGCVQRLAHRPEDLERAPKPNPPRTWRKDEYPG